MQSFVVWYKIIHSFIACLAFVILLHANQQPVEKNEYVEYVTIDTIYAMNFMLYVTIASLSDGYANDCKTMKVIKYGLFAFAILFIIYQWCTIYFE